MNDRFSAPSVAALLAISVESTVPNARSFYSPVLLVRHWFPHPGYAQTTLPPTPFSPRPMDQQRVRTARYLGFGPWKSTRILPVVAREVWPGCEGLSGRT